MTKKSGTRLEPQTLFCVCFIETSCYKVEILARNEVHAIALAKRRWYRGSNKSFIPCGGETDGWDACEE